jgi:hypothetical protein
VAPPSYPAAPYLSYKKNGAWIFYPATANRTPTHATLRALDEHGLVLTEQENDLEWARTGGAPHCPGPVTTAPITFIVA